MARRLFQPAAGLALLLAAAPLAQSLAQDHVTVPTLDARPDDVGSIDGIIKAFYEVISAPAGQPREWGRDRTLYLPDVRFVQTGADQSGKVTAQVVTHQQFVDAADAGMVKNGFFESEIHRVTTTFGNITQILSTYEMRSKPGAPVFGRGVNGIQLFWDGKRYWIASVMWDDERKGNPIPAALLP